MASNQSCINAEGIRNQATIALWYNHIDVQSYQYTYTEPGTMLWVLAPRVPSTDPLAICFHSIQITLVSSHYSGGNPHVIATLITVKHTSPGRMALSHRWYKPRARRSLGFLQPLREPSLCQRRMTRNKHIHTESNPAGGAVNDVLSCFILYPFPTTTLFRSIAFNEDLQLGAFLE